MRCADQWNRERGRNDLVKSEESFVGKGLDICICVHAEQNALLSAARFGISMEGATLYVTHQPCFTCLKQAVQAETYRIVYHCEYRVTGDKYFIEQYDELTKLLTRREGADNFLQLGNPNDERCKKGKGLTKPLTAAATAQPEAQGGADDPPQASAD